MSRSQASGIRCQELFHLDGSAGPKRAVACEQRGSELRQGAEGEPCEDYGAVEIEGTVGAVLTVVEECALVEEPDRLRFTVAAGAGLVDYFDLWQVVDEPACCASASAEVGVFEVHEKAFVQRADIPQGVPADDHAGAGDPVGRGRVDPFRDGGELALYERAFGEEASQERGAPEEP